MKSVVIALACALALGCAQTKGRETKTVKQMPPGYGVIVANFAYHPGESSFTREQILADAKYTAERLEAKGYQSFIVYCGGNTAQVGVRASTNSIAQSFKRQIDLVGKIDLGDGKVLPVPKTEIVNLAELQPGAVEKI